MKSKWLVFEFLVLFSLATRLHAQQSEADRELFEETKAKAEAGDAVSQVKLAGFLFANGLPKDVVESVRWCRKAAEQGNAVGQYNLGIMYANGKGVPKDTVEAVRWYRKAADQGLAFAQRDLGLFYLNGDGVAKDEVEAVKWFRKAAEQNDAGAQTDLGKCYEDGHGVPKDEVEGVKWYRKAADQNLAGAQFNLGSCYANGKGVPKDNVEAVKWYRKAADQNDDMAQYNLGLCHFFGEGVAQNYEEAMTWFRKAAEQNDAEAQYNLGLMFENGQGVTQDYAEAVKWYRKAAEQNFADAQSNLGSMYDNGSGAPKDAAEAVRWYRKAAEQGNAVAEYNLARMYSHGRGVPQSDVEAVNWFRKAAEQGNPASQYNLSAMYANGEGVPRNYIEAYKWESLAAAQGMELAKKYLPIVEMRMTLEQVAEAQKLASIFVPRTESSSVNSIKSILPKNPTATGSGFFITEDGFLVTNEHVVKEAAQVRLVTSAGLISARVVKVDAANDLALLKADGKFAFLPIASSRTIRMGNTVATIGFPNIGLQGFAPKLSKGEIASLSGASDDARYFQISLPVQPGNSGGALVDEQGNVVGVVSAKLNAAAALSVSGALPENVNYAVKSSYLLSFLESVPEISAKLKEPRSLQTPTPKFEDVVKSAEEAAVLVLVY